MPGEPKRRDIVTFVPSELTVVRVTPVNWIGTAGPREAYFVFRGDRLVEVVQERAEDITNMIAKGYPRDASIEIDVRPSQYDSLVSRARNPRKPFTLAMIETNPRQRQVARRLAEGRT